MAEYTGQTFDKGRAVEIDGNVYRKCIFDGARMRYSGGTMPTFDDCIIKNVTWAFGGPASNTLQFLSALHNHFGAPGRRDAEEMIGYIKSGKHRPF